MDARALGAAAGIGVVTVNAWVSRGYVPGIIADAQGRRRDFDVKAATHIAIMAMLVPFGFGAPFASLTARIALLKPAECHLFVPLIQEGSEGEVGLRFSFKHASFKSEGDLPKALDALEKEFPADQIPSAYTVINVPRAMAKMQAAEKDWQRRRKGREPRRKVNE